MNLPHRERRSLGPDRRGDGGRRARSGAGGAPGTARGEVVSKSVAKAPRTGIGRGRKRGISTFLFRRSGSIRAFATDLDKQRRCGPRDGRHGSRRRPPGAPDAETCTSHSKVQFQPSFSRAKCTSRRRSGPAAAVADCGDDPAVHDDPGLQAAASGERGSM